MAQREVSFSVQLDDDFEPAPDDNERKGLCVCALVTEMDSDWHRVISKAFEAHTDRSASGSALGRDDLELPPVLDGVVLLKLFGWSWNIDSYVRITVGASSIHTHLDYFSGMSRMFVDPSVTNAFFAHAEEHLYLFIGTRQFIQSCLAPIRGSLEAELERTVSEIFPFDTEMLAMNEFRRFMDKYNQLSTSVKL